MTKPKLRTFITDEQFRQTRDLGEADGVRKHIALTAIVKADEVKRILEGAAKATPLAAEPIVELTDRQVLFKMSDATVDRYNDTIDPKGWITDPWMKSGSWLWAHNPNELPVAKPASCFVFEAAIYSIAEFPPEGKYAFADTCLNLIRADVLRGCSVGFRPLKWMYNEERGGVDFFEQELLECSLTPVPANPNAVAISKAFGLDVDQNGVMPVTAEFVRHFTERMVGLVERVEKALATVPATEITITDVDASAIKERVAEVLAPLTRAGKVLSRANQDKLEQARTLIHDVLESANKDAEGDDEEDKSAIEVTPDQNTVADASNLSVEDMKQLAADLGAAIIESWDMITAQPQ
jgi:HK97 family phage prohead protease